MTRFKKIAKLKILNIYFIVYRNKCMTIDYNNDIRLIVVFSCSLNIIIIKKTTKSK